MIRLISALLTLITCSVYASETYFTTGPAVETIAGLKDCGNRSRVSAVGTIESDDGQQWTVPADTHFQTAPHATDLYNECGGNTLNSVTELDLKKVPLMDAGGDEEFIAYIFADNYFELSVNGTLLAVDPVPFTPFNSNVVRFKAQRPLSVAIKMVDWEENLGLGSEKNRGSNYHPGDGGLVAHFKDTDGNTVGITDANWKAQTFYTAPLADRDCLVINGSIRDSSQCSTDGPQDATEYSAAHWQIPADWTSPIFDDSEWPQATTFTNDTVGVNNKKAYTNFTEVFDAKGADAEFIWSTNLVLDNVVLLRTTFN